MTEDSKNWPPRECEMPELPEKFGNTFLTHILSVAFAGGGPSDSAAAAFSRNFIRLSDLAIQEYNRARQALVVFVSTPNEVVGPLFEAAGHLEQCIHALRRAIRFARHKNGPKLPKCDVISADVESRIRSIRNAIEHTDERIRDGRIQQGEFLMLAVKSNEMELEGNTITYTELARWLTQLQSLAEKVATFREKSENKP